MLTIMYFLGFLNEVSEDLVDVPLHELAAYLPLLRLMAARAAARFPALSRGHVIDCCLWDYSAVS